MYTFFVFMTGVCVGLFISSLQDKDYRYARIFLAIAFIFFIGAVAPAIPH